MPYLQAASLLLGMGNLGLNLLNYLSRTQSPAPVSTGIQAPFTPQFTGGQSIGVSYRVQVLTKQYSRYASGGGWAYRYIYIQYWKDFGITVSSPDIKIAPIAATDVAGAIQSVYINPSTGTLWAKTTAYPSGISLSGYAGETDPVYQQVIQQVEIKRVDNAADTGGNLPNPNPSISNPDGGYQDAPFPTAPPTTIVDRSTDADIIPSALPALVPATLAGLLALLRAAASIAELAQKIADLIEGIYSILRSIIDLLRELERLLPRKKSVVSIELGEIEKDGFMRIYPVDRTKLQAISLDILFTSIPNWKIDTILSLKSPKRFSSLGRILFVSATMGVIEEIELHYSILSLPIPENAIGFYYHLGMDGISKAKSTVFYLRDDRQ